MNIHFFGGMREVTGEAECQSSEENATVRSVMHTLSAAYGPRFERAALYHDGRDGTAVEKLNRECLFIVNGREVRFLEGIDTPLGAQDELCIFANYFTN